MKRLAFAVAACLTAGVASAEDNWTALFTTQYDYILATNTANISREGNKVGFWFAQAHKSQYVELEMAYVSVDCNDRSYFADDHKAYLKGKEIKWSHLFLPRKTVYRGERPGVDSVMQVVCNNTFDDFISFEAKSPKELTQKLFKIFDDIKAKSDKKKGSPF